MEKQFKVRAAHCDYRATEEEIYQTLRRITDPLTRAWKPIENAKKVVMKFNMMKPHERIIYYEGRRRELVDDATCRAVLRLIKEHTTAELIATDTNPYNHGHRIPPGFNYEPHLKEFDVKFVDSNLPPFKVYDVPGGGSMFDRYTLSACFDDADAVVSVAKMKNHAFMGITLCTKNLFGLPPMILPEGRTRSYYHHLIRLSYVLPDLALITKPCLNIIDALTGQWGREWGGEGRICNALIAGDHPISTDTIGMHLMGHDPQSDWPTPPFKRDRNHILIAAQRGFGTVNLDEIDWESEVTAPLAEFDSVETDTAETVANWRKTTCEQGLVYQENQKDLIDRYRDNFIYMQDGEVVWSGPDPSNLGSRRQLSGKRKDSALWLKLVDAEEHEGERFNVYDECLKNLQREFRKGDYEMGITDAQKKQLDEQGCIVIPDVLSDEEIEIYRADILRLAEEEKQNGLARQHTNGYGQHVRWLVNKGEMYEKLVARPKVMPFFEHLLGSDYTLSTLTSNIIDPGAPDGGYHVDSVLGSMPEPLPSFPLVANSLWLLDDFTPENGGTRHVPGIHLQRIKPPPGTTHHPDEVRLSAPKGSVFLFNGAIWHSAGANKTDRQRIALICFCCRSFVKPMFDFVHHLKPEVVERATPTMRRIYGFDSQPQPPDQPTQ